MAESRGVKAETYETAVKPISISIDTPPDSVHDKPIHWKSGAFPLFDSNKPPAEVKTHVRKKHLDFEPV